VNQFRLDALTREWVAIVGHRQARPNLPGDDCPFCVGGVEAPDPYVVKAFENRWPPFEAGPSIDAAVVPDADGFMSLPPRGAAEVVLYSPVHDATLASIGVEGARRVVDLWAERTQALLTRPEIAYVLVFENRGAEVGATITHPHGQIYGFPFVPPVARREAEIAAAHGCVLCDETPREAAAGTRVVFDADDWLAWVPFASGYPFGLLIAPRRHVSDLQQLDSGARDGMAAALVDVLGRYDRLFSKPFPYLLWVHPGVHLHVHLAPPLRDRDRMRYVASGETGSGTLSNPVVPEDAAARLRDA
jgi:UDPglucose--hexose-1-phosphate uridylyltransferase